MLLIALIVSLSAALLFPRIGRELVPEDDQSEFGVSVNLPRGTTFSVTEQYVRDIEPMLRQLPNVQSVFTNINNNYANFFVGLTPLDQRKVSQQDIIREVRGILRTRYPGTRIQVSGGTDLSGASTASIGGGNWNGGGDGRGNRLQMLIQGPEIEDLQHYVVQLIENLRTVPGLVDVDTNFEATQ
jgi:HAE1 family hydrophobic/amphiphilic exporter-1